MRRLQLHQDGLKLNGTHQLLFCAGYGKMLCGSVHAVKNSTETVVVLVRRVDWKGNADKTKYMVMSRDRNSGRSHKIKINYKSFERVEEFKYFGNNSNKSKFYSERN